MYSVENSGAVLTGHKRLIAVGRGRVKVSSTVLLLGMTSLLTDISSEMVSAVLPLYLVFVSGFSPLAFGVIDGIYQGGAALVRVAAGFAGDRWQRHKEVAAAGYGLSAVCRLALLTAGSALGTIGAVVLADRTGKGIRTAPRDAMISLSTPPDQLGTAFGVHRAMDTTGAMIGPLLAFAILAAAPLAFHSIFLVSFCFAVVGLMVLVLFVRNPQRAHPAPEKPASIRGAAGLLQRGRFRTVLIAGGVLAAVTASDAFIYLALQEELDIGARWFPLLFVGTALVFMSLAVPIGRLADRIGRARVFVAGHLLLGLVYASLISPVLGDATLPLCMLMLGTYYAATDGVLAAMGSALLPEELRGSGLALLGTSTNIAKLVASIAFGAAWSLFGLAAAFTIFGCALAVALAFAAPALRRA
jgi:MFS family permease